MPSLTKDILRQFRSSFDADRESHVLQAALAKTGLAELSFVPTEAAKLKGAFTIDIKTRGITAQEKSGRCWLFAALNILREIVAEKCGLESFELSENYLSFYDKLEKANNLLEMAIEHAEEPVKGQQMQYILRVWNDGGYWSQAVDLIEKYGVVPKQVQPESYQSEHTAAFNATINRLLRKDIMELRELASAGKNPYERKREMTAEIYRALCIAFGQPVETFDFVYRDKDGTYHEDRQLTPHAFYDKYVGVSLRDYMPVINEQTPDKPIGRRIRFHAIENMVDRDMEALNLTQEELEDLCVKQLKAGKPVWFACDAGAFGARKDGVWDPASVRPQDLLGGFSLSVLKGKGLEYGINAVTHAMLLTGVHFDAEGKPDRWKIENSWGKDVGDQGYFVCSEAYFRDYVFEAVIDRMHFTSAQRAMLLREPVVINAWDEDV